MFDGLSRDEIQDLVDLSATEYSADDVGQADDPSCDACLCCYGGCACCR
jgi:hypothetical protein